MNSDQSFWSEIVTNGNYDQDSKYNFLDCTVRTTLIGNLWGVNRCFRIGMTDSLKQIRSESEIRIFVWISSQLVQNETVYPSESAINFILYRQFWCSLVALWVEMSDLTVTNWHKIQENTSPVSYIFSKKQRFLISIVNQFKTKLFYTDWRRLIVFLPTFISKLYLVSSIKALCFVWRIRKSAEINFKFQM